MKQIVLYIKEYWKETSKRVFSLVVLLTAVLIFCNYYFAIDGLIRKNTFPVKLFAWYMVFAIAFSLPYLLYHLLAGRKYGKDKNFILLLFIAPFLFAVKLTVDFDLHFTGSPVWDNYWQHIIYWPLLTVITLFIVYIIWRKFDKRDQPFYGAGTKNMNWKPYWLMLLIMLPLVAAASTQPDFLAYYPKLYAVTGVNNEGGLHWWHKLLFELSYGSDFINIEFFFRGFLILAFAKWAGKDAILPMACFYCTIHFGKPMGECISSFFGGMILGIVVYNTRSVFGGLMVHLGIAWLMEAGGYIGNAFIR